jgi:hypothetical protein
MDKKITIISGCLLVLLFAAAVITAGCTGSTDDSGKTTPVPTESINKTASETTAQATAEETPASTPAASENLTISGTGDKNATINLPKGVSLFTMVQDKPVKSLVSITTEKDGIAIENIYNESIIEKSMTDGKYYWTYAFSLEEEAAAKVEVTTTSEWTLDFSFPQMINGIVPQTFTGAANKATPFFQINEGEYNFSIKADNNEYVSVTLMDYYGNPVMKDNRELPLSFHMGSYDEVAAVKINESCNYLINVMCDGNWTVSVEQA